MVQEVTGGEHGWRRDTVLKGVAEVGRASLESTS